MPRQISLREIAAQAGVSHVTVSRALRGSPSISDATRDHIQKVARELGWLPNPVISEVMAGRRMRKAEYHGEQIAYLNQFAEGERWKQFGWLARFVHGLTQRAEEFGYGIDNIGIGGSGICPRRIRDVLKARGIRGVVLGSAEFAGAHLPLEISEFAVVAQGFTIFRPATHRASPNIAQGIMTGVRELRKLGYKRIALCIHPQVDMRVHYAFSAGYLAAQMLLPKSSRMQIFYIPRVKRTEIKRWLLRCRPDAILSGEADFRTLLPTLGFQIPGDIGFACMDLHRGYYAAHEGCAGVDMQLEETAAAAVDLVISQLHSNSRGEPRTVQTVLTDAKWVPGETVRRVGPPAPMRNLGWDRAFVNR